MNSVPGVQSHQPKKTWFISTAGCVLLCFVSTAGCVLLASSTFGNFGGLQVRSFFQLRKQDLLRFAQKVVGKRNTYSPKCWFNNDFPWVQSKQITQKTNPNSWFCWSKNPFRESAFFSPNENTNTAKCQPAVTFSKQFLIQAVHPKTSSQTGCRTSVNHYEFLVGSRHRYRAPPRRGKTS